MYSAKFLTCCCINILCHIAIRELDTIRIVPFIIFYKGNSTSFILSHCTISIILSNLCLTTSAIKVHSPLIEVHRFTRLICDISYLITIQINRKIINNTIFLLTTKGSAQSSASEMLDVAILVILTYRLIITVGIGSKITAFSINCRG